ncbi:hypothetical protein [Paenibacillus sp. NPDC057967]|uniref:hypothetical protein n=1 Tax=Paenibacillus sp. NPDC057967 TaxID=3346293 RepID=UPI0036D77EAB
MKPRSEKYGTRQSNQLLFRFKKFNEFFRILLRIIVIVTIIFGVMFLYQNGNYHSVIETIIASLLAGCAIGIVIPNKKAFFICLFNYIIYPLSITLFIITLGNSLLYSLGVENIPSIYLLLFLGLFAPCIALIPSIRRRKDKEYLKRAKTANDILQVFVGMCAFAAIYALHNTDYSVLITELNLNLEEIEKMGLQGRDLFNNMVLGTTFPLLMTSNLLNTYLNNRIEKLNSQ